MVSKAVKLYNARKKLRLQFDKGQISAKEYRQGKAYYDQALEAENTKGLIKLAEAPKEKVVGNAQEAARKTLAQKQTITRKGQIIAVSDQYGNTYKGKEVGSNFIGIRTVGKREQQLKANIRQGFYSFVAPSQTTKTKGQIIAEQTAIRGSLGIYSPSPPSTDIKYKFTPPVEAPKQKEKGLKGAYLDFSKKAENVYQEFKFRAKNKEGIKFAIGAASADFAQGYIGFYANPILYPKETIVGITRVAFPIYWPEIARDLYKETTTRPARLAGGIAGSYTFFKAAGAAKEAYKNSNLKGRIDNIDLRPNKVKYDGFKSFREQQAARVEANLAAMNYKDEILNTYVRDSMRPEVAKPENLYIGYSAKTGSIRALDIETGIKSGELIQVQQGTQVKIIPFNFGYGQEVISETQTSSVVGKYSGGRSSRFNTRFKSYLGSDKGRTLRLLGETLPEAPKSSNYFIPVLFKSPGSDTKLRTGITQTQGSRSTPREISGERLQFKPVFDNLQINKPINIQIQAQGQRQAQAQKQSQAQETKQETALTTIPKTIQTPKNNGILRPKTSFKPQPKIPNNFFPSFNTNKKTKNVFSFKGFKSLNKQPKDYAPTLRASLFNLKGASLGTTTGLEERYLKKKKVMRV